MRYLRFLAAAIILPLIGVSAFGPVFGPVFASESSLTGDIRIESSELGYALQYRVYTPAGYEDHDNLPTIYVTDGQAYLRGGQMDQALDREIASGRIPPVVAVFVDPRNPDDLHDNRRNQQFFCNPNYSEFFRSELVPVISENYRVSDAQADRVILGISFGGLNAGCFGVQAYDIFGGIGMQSPAMHPVPTLYDAYDKEERRPIRIFLSAGREQAITHRSVKLRRALERKGYTLRFKKTKEGHNWQNWRPQLPELLSFFFAGQQKGEGK